MSAMSAAVRGALGISLRTFIFAYILQGKGETRIFSLDNSYFSKGSSADDSQQSEVVEVYYVANMNSSARHTKSNEP